MRYPFLIFLVIFLVPAVGTGDGLYNNDSRMFIPAHEMKPSDGNDPAELERVWQAALVRIPKQDGKFIATTVKELHTHKLEGSEKFPTVIYLHGCYGHWSGTIMRIDFLASSGYAVIAPPSMARKKYARSCDVVLLRGGFYRGVLKIRHADAGYAIEKAKTLPWVDANHVFLMGLSEGGITTATFRSDSKGASVRARVVEGWSCQAGWDEYRGVNAPAGEPVLALLGEKDPWFQNPWNRGDCGTFIDQRGDGSKSVVYTEGDLSHRHMLFEDERVQAEVLEFLRAHH